MNLRRCLVMVLLGLMPLVADSLVFGRGHADD